MSTWPDDELKRVGDADELHVASIRDDGTLRPAVTIWHVRVGNDLYIRSAQGPERGWFRRARAAGAGRISSGGIERDVTFEPAPADVHNAVTTQYHAKYDRYGPGPVGAVTGPDVEATTLRVVPQD